MIADELMGRAGRLVLVACNRLAPPAAFFPIRGTDHIRPEFFAST